MAKIRTWWPSGDASSVAASEPGWAPAREVAVSRSNRMGAWARLPEFGREARVLVVAR